LIGRWFLFAVVGIGIYVYLNAPDSGAAAKVTQACAPDGATISVGLEWEAPDAGAVASYVDIGLSGDFPAYGYSAHGPLEAAARSHSFAGLPPGVMYHYRVNTLYAEGWRETARGSFKTECVVPTVAAAR
jgi:hypothetical protein